MNDLNNESPSHKISVVEEKDSLNISDIDVKCRIDPGQEQFLDSIEADRLAPSENSFRQRSTSHGSPKTSPSRDSINRSSSIGSSHKYSPNISPHRSPLKISTKKRSSQGSPKRSPSRLSPMYSPSAGLNRNVSYPESEQHMSPSRAHSDCDQIFLKETMRYQKERFNALIKEMNHLETNLVEQKGKNKSTRETIDRLMGEIKMSNYKEEKISEEYKKRHLDTCIIKAMEQKTYYENILKSRKTPQENEFNSGESSTWVCESCTLVNDENSSECAVCFQPNYNKSST